jgi:cholesterol oxidase
LFVDDGDPTRKRMLYRLHVRDHDGRPLTLTGFKAMSGQTGLKLWPHTTTLFTRILEGHVGPEEDVGATVVGAGIVRIHLTDFLRQLTTFRTEGESVGARAAALARFGTFFAGQLWDVYGRRALSNAPF